MSRRTPRVRQDSSYDDKQKTICEGDARFFLLSFLSILKILVHHIHGKVIIVVVHRVSMFAGQRWKQNKKSRICPDLHVTRDNYVIVLTENVTFFVKEVSAEIKED